MTAWVTALLSAYGHVISRLSRRYKTVVAVSASSIGDKGNMIKVTGRKGTWGMACAAILGFVDKNGIG